MGGLPGSSGHLLRTYHFAVRASGSSYMGKTSRSTILPPSIDLVGFSITRTETFAFKARKLLNVDILFSKVYRAISWLTKGFPAQFPNHTMHNTLIVIMTSHISYSIFRYHSQRFDHQIPSLDSVRGTSDIPQTCKSYPSHKDTYMH